MPSSSNLSEAWVDFIAGWASGAASIVLCQPMDTVLTRLQAGGLVATATATTTTTATTATAPTSASSSAQITKNLVGNFGFTSLWRGSSPMISAVPIQNSLLMGGYGIGKQWAELEGSSNKYVPIFVGGCTGGVIQSFFISPVEWIKVQSQVEGKNAYQATRQLYQNHALRRGLTATLLRDGIPHGVWFASYEWCKTFLDNCNTDNNSTHRQLSIPLFSGAFAATLAWVGIGKKDGRNSMNSLEGP